MRIEIDGSDIIDNLPIILGVFLGIMVIALVFYFIVRMQDNNKKLVTRKVKVLEKPVQQGNIEWYVVECENGERLRLRSFHADSIIIAVGDTGIVHYKGKTIQSFQRK